MGNQAGFRFGQDGPSRITVVPSMYTEASEVMPLEPVYYPVVPFLPSVISGGNGSGGISLNGSASAIAAALANNDWKAYPDKLDLFWWQGDDVFIELVFADPVDMSGWVWESDVRVWPAYQSELRYSFITTGAFYPEVVDPDTLEVIVPAHTRVTLFLPRQLNKWPGKAAWELHSISPYDGPPPPVEPPDGVDPDDWPPTTQLKTWIYGNVTIVPRTNDTDFLPPQPDGTPIVVVSHNWPNGMVP